MTGGDRKQFGGGVQGKGDGSGAMTDLRKDRIGENQVLSNRDKKSRTKQRGMDGKHIQTEQLQDHEGNRLDDEAS